LSCQPRWHSAPLRPKAPYSLGAVPRLCASLRTLTVLIPIGWAGSRLRTSARENATTVCRTTRTAAPTRATTQNVNSPSKRASFVKRSWVRPPCDPLCTAQSPNTPPRSIGPGCSDTCWTGLYTWYPTQYYAGDGRCDDGGPGAEYTACSYASDCTDCGPRPDKEKDSGVRLNKMWCGGGGPEPCVMWGGDSYVGQLLVPEGVGVKLYENWRCPDWSWQRDVLGPNGRDTNAPVPGFTIARV